MGEEKPTVALDEEARWGINAPSIEASGTPKLCRFSTFASPAFARVFGYLGDFFLPLFFLWGLAVFFSAEIVHKFDEDEEDSSELLSSSESKSFVHPTKSGNLSKIFSEGSILEDPG